MKKLLMNLVKYINHFTNHRITPKEEARTIVKYMLLHVDSQYAISVMDEVEEQFKEEMLRRQSEAYKIAYAVNQKYRPDPIKPRVYNPDYDKSFKELEVNFSN